MLSYWKYFCMMNGFWLKKMAVWRRCVLSEWVITKVYSVRRRSCILRWHINSSWAFSPLTDPSHGRSSKLPPFTWPAGWSGRASLTTCLGDIWANIKSAHQPLTQVTMHGKHIVSFANTGKGGERPLVGAVLSQHSKLPEGPPHL